MTSTRALWLSAVLAAACGKVEQSASDAGSTDAAPGDPADAAPGTPDARPLPTAPPVTSGQAAELVLGQPDFESTGTGLSDDQFFTAAGLASDGAHLWVTDTANARVVQYNSQPVVNQPKADLALGQSSLAEDVAGPDGLHLTPPAMVLGDVISDVSSAGTVVAVADAHANRVLLWNEVPGESGVNWDIVLGQTTPTGAAAGTSDSELSQPRGVFTDGDVLLVADTQNHRVLLWNSIPTVHGQAADLVLGQADFDSAEAPSPPTPSSMSEPADVFFDGERLYVSDAQNHRIMVWVGLPTENHAPADYFVGQTSGSTGGENAGAGAQEENATGLHIPGQITVAHGSLFITDLVNFRVVVHTPRPASSGEEADAVLGFADFEGTALADGTQGFTPRGLAVFADKLYLADTNVAAGHSRVLRYQLDNLP